MEKPWIQFSAETEGGGEKESERETQRHREKPRQRDRDRKTERERDLYQGFPTVMKVEVTHVSSLDFMGPPYAGTGP